MDLSSPVNYKGMEGFALDAITAAGSGGGHSCKVSKEKSKLPNYDIQILVGCFERYKRKRLVDVGLGGPSPPLSPNSNYNTSNPSNLIKDKLVVVINDFESFDPQLFHSFVNICR